MKARSLAIISIAAAIAMAPVAIAPMTAGAASTSHLDYYIQGNTVIRNDDFNNQVVSATGVDWAVDLLFIQSAHRAGE
jgi:hypothetical protein